MNKNILMWILGLLLLTTFAAAQDKECWTDQPCTVIATIFNTTENYLPATNANYTLFDENGTILINNSNMTNIGTGKFAFSFTPNATGQFLGQAVFDNTYIGVETIYIKEGTQMLNELLFVFVVFAFVIGLYFLSRYLKNPFIEGFTGLIFMMITLTSYEKFMVFGFGKEATISTFVLFSVILIMDSIYYRRAQKLRKAKNALDDD